MIDLESILSYFTPMAKALQMQGMGSPRGVGRPREFDLSAVLDAAVLVFREKGFGSTSISDLSEATSLTAGSIYKAFKDKKGVFLAALDHYASKRNADLQNMLADARTGREQLRAFVSVYVDASSGHEGRRGCMVVSALTEITTLDPESADAVRKSYARLEDRLLKILRHGEADGTINPPIEAKNLSRIILCTLQGMRLAGKLGFVGDQRNQIVNDIMRLVS